MKTTNLTKLKIVFFLLKHHNLNEFQYHHIYFFIFVCLYNKLNVYDQSPDYRPKLKFMK